MKTDTTNEVARLREENANLKGIIRAIIENRRLHAKSFSENADDFEEMLNGLSAAPEEPTHEGITMQEWYGGIAQIERTEPAPDHFVDANKMIPEWRELGPDEVIDYCRKWAAEHLSDHGKETFYARLGLLVDFATDFYSDEIQKLKEAKP